MAVKVRLTRLGRKKCPMYRIIAIDSREKRDGAALEILGSYDSKKAILQHYQAEQLDAWVKKGAVVSDAVKKVIKSSKKVATSAA